MAGEAGERHLDLRRRAPHLLRGRRREPDRGHPEGIPQAGRPVRRRRPPPLGRRHQDQGQAPGSEPGPQRRRGIQFFPGRHLPPQPDEDPALQPPGQGPERHGQGRILSPASPSASTARRRRKRCRPGRRSSAMYLERQVVPPARQARHLRQGRRHRLARRLHPAEQPARPGARHPATRAPTSASISSAASAARASWRKRSTAASSRSPSPSAPPPSSSCSPWPTPARSCRPSRPGSSPS